MASVRTRSKQPRNKLVKRRSSTGDIKAAKRKPVNDGIVKKKKKVGGAPATTTSSGRPSLVQAPLKRKRRTYSEKELDVPQLNMITPIGVVKPPGTKKGKEFVDDAESMATIMAIVQAEKEGQIESKVMKARRMEEIREARRLEADQKEKERLEKLNKIKDSMRKKRKRKGKVEGGVKDDDGDGGDGGKNDVPGEIQVINSAGSKEEKPKKRVSFAV